MKTVLNLKSRVTVNRTVFSDGACIDRVRARSDRHARRLAAILNWSSFYRGPGRPFADVYYVKGYLVRRQGLDV